MLASVLAPPAVSPHGLSRESELNSQRFSAPVYSARYQLISTTAKPIYTTVSQLPPSIIDDSVWIPAYADPRRRRYYTCTGTIGDLLNLEKQRHSSKKQMQGAKTREVNRGLYDAAATLKQLALRLDANEQQAHPRPPNRLLERTIVRRTPPHRASRFSSTSRTVCRRHSRITSSSIISNSGNTTTFLLLTLILGRLKLRTASGERGHRTRVAVAREKEKGGAWGESGVQRRELLIEIRDGLEQAVLLFLPWRLWWRRRQRWDGAVARGFCVFQSGPTVRACLWRDP